MHDAQPLDYATISQKYRNADLYKHCIGDVGEMVMSKGTMKQLISLIRDHALCELLVEWSRKGEPPEVEYVRVGPPIAYQP